MKSLRMALTTIAIGISIATNCNAQFQEQANKQESTKNTPPSSTQTARTPSHQPQTATLEYTYDGVWETTRPASPNNYIFKNRTYIFNQEALWGDVEFDPTIVDVVQDLRGDIEPPDDQNDSNAVDAYNSMIDDAVAEYLKSFLSLGQTISEGGTIKFEIQPPGNFGMSLWSWLGQRMNTRMNTVKSTRNSLKPSRKK